MAEVTSDNKIVEQSDTDARASATNGSASPQQTLLAISTEMSDEVARFRSVWSEEVDTKIRTPLKELFQNALLAHADHRAELYNTTSDNFTIAALDNYITGTRADVLQPIFSFFSEKNCADVVGDAFASGLEVVKTLEGRYPSEIVVDETPDIFRPAPSDSWSTFFRKRAARLKRMFGGSKRRVRRVPIFAITQYHLHRRLPIIASPLHDDLQESLANIVGLVESTASHWIHDTLASTRQVRRRMLSQESADNPEGTEEQEEPNHPAADVFESGEAFQNRLLQLVDLCEQIRAESDKVTVKFDMAQSLFDTDLRDGGTFLLPLSDRRLRKGEYQAGEILNSKRETWHAWHSAAQDRFKLLDRLLALRATVYQLARRVLDRIDRTSLQPAHRAFAKIREGIVASKTEIESAKETATIESLQELITGQHKKLTRLFDRAIASLPGLVSRENALTEPGKEEWKAFSRFVDTLPEKLVVHPLKEDHQMVDPLLWEREIEFQHGVRGVVFDSIAAPLRQSASKLQQGLVRAWTEFEQVRHISLFNLEAAAAELSGENIDEEVEAGESEEPVDNFTAGYELAVVGADRAVAALDELVQKLENPWREFSNTVDKEFFEEWNAIHIRVRTLDQSSGRMADLNTRIDRLRERSLANLRAGWAETKLRWAVTARAVTRRINRLIRKGRTAVGAVKDDQALRAQTVEAISSVVEFKSTLPLVYRRLFSFDALEDSSLLEGRSEDIDWARNHYERWQTGHHVGLAVVVGMPGSGRTSFLNALASTTFEDVVVHKLTLSHRIEDEATLIRALTETAELSGDISTFAELENALQTLAGDLRPIYLIDNVEHLMLNCARGRELIEEFLLFLSRSDTRICWIMSIAAPAWKYLRKTAPAAAGFVVSRHLDDLGKFDYESLIMNRHRRSGMPVHFLEPATSTALARQRLRKASTDEEKQEILRENYFDRLSKLCGQNVMLGLFYWLRSADFEADAGVLTVKPIVPLYFDFLNKMEQPLAFTLRAMLVHNTLNVEEHNKIFRLGSDETTFILDTLLNGGLVHASDIALDRTKATDRNFFDPTKRYRIHPLVIHNIVQFLRGRNILH